MKTAWGGVGRGSGTIQARLVPHMRRADAPNWHRTGQPTHPLSNTPAGGNAALKALQALRQLAAAAVPQRRGQQQAGGVPDNLERLRPRKREGALRGGWLFLA